MLLLGSFVSHITLTIVWSSLTVGHKLVKNIILSSDQGKHNSLIGKKIKFQQRFLCRAKSNLKMVRNKDASWPENLQILSFAGFIWLFCQYTLTEVLFCFKFEVSSWQDVNIQGSTGCSHAGWFFANEEQIKVGSWHNLHSCHTCHMHLWCYRLGKNGTAHIPVFITFKWKFLNKLDCNCSPW